MKLETVKEYTQRYEAEMDLSIILDDGIDAILNSDDCGGLLPHLGTTEGYSIQVREEDLEKVKALLDHPE